MKHANTVHSPIAPDPPVRHAHCPFCTDVFMSSYTLSPCRWRVQLEWISCPLIYVPGRSKRHCSIIPIKRLKFIVCDFVVRWFCFAPLSMGPGEVTNWRCNGWGVWLNLSHFHQGLFFALPVRDIRRHSSYEKMDRMNRKGFIGSSIS